MNRYVAGAAAALLFLPAGLAAQGKLQTEGSAAVRMEGRGSGGGESAAGSAALDATAAAGLPQLHVRKAIEEGKANGASRQAIDQAAMEAHARLVATRELFSESSASGRRLSEAELTAAADAMAAGASRRDIGRLRDAAPADRSLEASFEALTRLTASGGAGEGEASREIAAELKAGASDAQITGLINRAADLERSTRSIRPGAGAPDVRGRAGVGISGVSDALGGAAQVTGSLGGGVF